MPRKHTGKKSLKRSNKRRSIKKRSNKKRVSKKKKVSRKSKKISRKRGSKKKSVKSKKKKSVRKQKGGENILYPGGKDRVHNMKKLSYFEAIDKVKENLKIGQRFMFKPFDSHLKYIGTYKGEKGNTMIVENIEIFDQQIYAGDLIMVVPLED